LVTAPQTSDLSTSTPDTTDGADDAMPVSRPRGRARRLARILGTVLIVLGVGAVAWTIVVWRWQDPFTALYTLYQQHKLSGQYKKIEATYHPLVAKRAATKPKATISVAEERRLVAQDARRYQRTLHAGHALGRIKVPRLGLNIVLVTSTDHDSLTKGPGWYTGSFLPGAGRLIYIAGHRTTYLAPFAHIDSLRAGDRVTIQVPYGTFVYRVTRHVIVPSDDLAQLRQGSREVLKLQACHPRFFATHRYIVYAVPVRVDPKGGKPYNLRP
jgi:sortase A